MGSLLNTLRSSKPPRIMSILYLLTVVGMVAACQPKGETHTQIKVPGFIITGGWNSAAQKKIELWNPVSRRTCPLPDLHEVMVGHSQCGNLLCGQNSCLKMTSTGSFSSAPVSLLQFRDNHLCWSLPGGGGEVMLLGGSKSTEKTEVISSNFNSTKPSWDLKYKTRLACGVERRHLHHNWRFCGTLKWRGSQLRG